MLSNQYEGQTLFCLKLQHINPYKFKNRIIKNIPEDPLSLEK